MLRNILYTALLFGSPLLLVSCKDEAAPSQKETTSASTEKALLGTWETVEIEVDYTTHGGSDSTVHELIREADFGRLYGARPPQTVFTPDGKHRRTHRFKDGTPTDIINGLWKVHNADTLLFIEPNKTLYYAYELTDDRLTLNGLTDSDYDGEIDDRARTVLRLVARATYTD